MRIGSLGPRISWCTRAMNFSIYKIKMEGAWVQNFRHRGQIQMGTVPKNCRVNRAKVCNLWCGTRVTVIHPITLMTASELGPLVFFIMTAVCGRPFFSLGLRFLGIYISSDLSWTKHCDFIMKKANRRLYAIRKLKGARVKENDLVAVHCSLIWSILEYGSVAFAHLSNYLSNTLEGIQKRGLSIIYLESSYDVALKRSNLTIHWFPDEPKLVVG